MNDHGVTVAVGMMVSPYPPQMGASCGRFHTPSASNAEICIQDIMKEELAGDAWNILKKTEETREAAIIAVCSNRILRSLLTRHLYDQGNCKKSVSRNNLFSILIHD